MHSSRFTVMIVALCLAAVCRAEDAKPVKLTLSRETTYVTGPLLPDGFVDYVRAFEGECAKGVTAENNAGPLLLRAFGSSLYGSLFTAGRQDHVKAAWAALKAEGPAPVEEETLVAYWDVIPAVERRVWEPDKKEPALSARAQRVAAAMTKGEVEAIRKKYKSWLDFTQAVNKNPVPPTNGWAAEDYPLLELWLRVNEKPLALVAEAVKKERLYLPAAAAENASMFDANRPGSGMMREASKLMLARGMKRVLVGDGMAAWEEVMRCYRLAELASQEPGTISLLSGSAGEAQANYIALHLVVGGALSVKEMKRCLADLMALKPRPSMMRAHEIGERFYALDAVGTFRRGLTTDKVPAPMKRAIDELIDWDFVLREMNKLCDEQVATFSGKTYPERAEAGRALNAKRKAHMKAFQERLAKELEDVLKEMGPKTDMNLAMLAYFIQRATKVPKEQWRPTFSRDLTDMLSGILGINVFESTTKTDALARARLDLLRVTLALTIFRAEKKRYPMALEELKPGYLKEIPLDHFTEKPLVYRAEGNGFLLYSVGGNQVDDGGAYTTKEESSYADAAVKVVEGKLVESW